MAPLIERPTERPARAAFVGALVAALITLPGLGVGTLWDNSETAYGEVAREILLGHDWIVMHFNGLPYFIQPPLYFWLGALCAMIWGPTSFALRFPASLATIALAALTGYAVARQAGTRVGIYASAILSSCLMVAVIGRLAIMDALLNLTVAAAIFWWFRALETGRDRYTVYGSIAAALGFLAKGPVAPVMALLVIVPFFLWNGRHERMYVPSLRAWAVALLAFVAIALPWPLALVSRDHL
ncbi:MAG TPA: glycosyltransferase family 39 protein, partial [Candidatus Baltobacteraceae bacterium]|nr:glycosyltransferase family 39 protein [Candidatus Baltobacteraceae bacterium]